MQIWFTKCFHYWLQTFHPTQCMVNLYEQLMETSAPFFKIQVTSRLPPGYLRARDVAAPVCETACRAESWGCTRPGKGAA